MKKLLSFFVCTLIVLMFIVTCPDKQKHQEIIKSSLSERFDKKLSEDSSTSSSLFSLLGSVITTNILDVFLSSELRVDNYFLFSLGVVSWQGEEKTVSLGVLNHVFTFFSDKEKEELRNME